MIGILLENDWNDFEFILIRVESLSVQILFQSKNILCLAS